MTNSISFNLQDTYEIGGLEEIVMYGKFYVTFRDMKGITYTSNIISELKSVPDSKGLVEFNIDDLVYSKEYQRYHELWYSNVYLSEGIKEPETNFFILGKLYNSSTQNFATKVFEISLNNIDDSPEDISRKGILGEMKYENNLVLTSIQNDLDISKMKETYKKVERDYLAAKEEYTTKNISTLKNQVKTTKELDGYVFTLNDETNNSYVLYSTNKKETRTSWNLFDDYTCYYNKKYFGFIVSLRHHDRLVSMGAIELI